MIRPVQLADANSIERINRESLNYNYPLVETRKRLAEVLDDELHHFVLVAITDSGELSGYIQVEVYRTLYAQPVFNVLALAVLPEFWGQGYGRQLMTAVEDEARKRHLAGIRLNSGVERTKAHQFYQHLGFHEIKSQKKFVKDLKLTDWARIRLDYKTNIILGVIPSNLMKLKYSCHTVVIV